MNTFNTVADTVQTNHHTVIIFLSFCFVGTHWVTIRLTSLRTKVDWRLYNTPCIFVTTSTASLDFLSRYWHVTDIHRHFTGNITLGTTSTCVHYYSLEVQRRVFWWLRTTYQEVVGFKPYEQRTTTSTWLLVVGHKHATVTLASLDYSTTGSSA
jgi:hypothetical protein